MVDRWRHQPSRAIRNAPAGETQTMSEVLDRKEFRIVAPIWFTQTLAVKGYSAQLEEQGI